MEKPENSIYKDFHMEFMVLISGLKSSSIQHHGRFVKYKEDKVSEKPALEEVVILVCK